MGFGTELWDQVPAVEQFGQDGHQFNTTVADFFERIGKESKQQSKDLEKTVDTCMPTSQKKQPRRMEEPQLRTTLLTAWMKILKEKQSVADRHYDFATTIDRHVIDNMKSMTREKDVMRARLLEDVKRMREEMQNQYKHLDSARVFYEKKARKSVDAKRHLERFERNLSTNRSDMDKARATSERRHSKAVAAEQSYRRSILDTNERQRRYFQHDLRDALDGLQQIEAERIERTKEILSEFVISEMNLLDGMTKNIEHMKEAVTCIDPERDINTFIAENRTGEGVPDDIGFLPYNPSLGRAPSYGTGGATVTKSSLLGKKELQAADLESMPVDRQAKVLESKIKEIQLEKVEMERRKIDAELRFRDVGPKGAYQEEQNRLSIENFDRNIDRLDNEMNHYQEWLDRIQQGETIQPVPMTTVGGTSQMPKTQMTELQTPETPMSESQTPTPQTIGGLAGTSTAEETPSSMDPSQYELPVTKYEEQEVTSGAEEPAQFTTEPPPKRGIVDRVVGTIFHPREP